MGKVTVFGTPASGYTVYAGRVRVKHYDVKASAERFARKLRAERKEASRA